MRALAFNRQTGVWVLLKSLLRDNPLALVITAVAMTVSSFIQGFGIAMLSPLLGMIGFPGPTSTGRMATLISAVLKTIGLPMTVPTVLFLFLLLVILENVFKYFEMSYSHRFIVNFVETLRNKLFDAYLKAEWPYWLQMRIGHMAGRLTEENMRVENALSALVVFLSNIILMSVLLGVALVFSWPMALIFLVTGGLLILLMESPLFKQRGSISISSQASEVQEVVYEHLNAAKLIKSSGLVAESLSAFQRVVRDLHEIEHQKWRHVWFTSSIFNPLIIGILCIGFYCAVGPLHIPQSKAIVILFIYFRLAARLSGTRDLGHTILALSPSYAAILQDIHQAEEHVEELPNRERLTLPVLAKGMDLEDVTFSYQPEKPVLSNISLSIKANQTTAIVGESGSGKSTLLDLVVGLLKPVRGNVLIDGRPLKDLELSAWRDQLGYVGQETILFNDTVLQNIRWANPRATDIDIEQAARTAQAHDFIQGLPSGYHTTIGNRGVRISGGERQRLALARALVRQPQVLILDEATSALDSLSEKLIQEAIEQLRRRMTIIIVTHRLSTIRAADMIYVMERGRLVEKGSWESLTRASGPFHTIWQTQQK